MIYFSCEKYGLRRQLMSVWFVLSQHNYVPRTANLCSAYQIVWKSYCSCSARAKALKIINGVIKRI